MGAVAVRGSTTGALSTLLLSAILGVSAVVGDSAMADEPDEPAPMRALTLEEWRRPIVRTGQNAIDLAEVFVRLRYGEAELDAQRPLFVLYEGETPDGIAFTAIVGSKTELTDVDILGVPMRIQVHIGRQDGRLVEIGFYHGIGVPDEAWVPPQATDETDEDR